MACGSCAGKRNNVAYEVTLRDGTKVTERGGKQLTSMAEVRLVMETDVTVGRPAPTWRPISKIK